MKATPVDLHYRELGEPGKPPLIMLHGLFGSATNWLGIAGRLAQDYHLILPDLRNHGRSPHSRVMNYEAMGEDLRALMQRLGLESAHLLGHSLGGKCAMWLALQSPQFVDKLVVADIAPVDYPNRFGTILEALNALDPAKLDDREEADRLLARRLENPGLRQYLLQNLTRQTTGWQWRFNLPVIAENIDQLLSFPSVRTEPYPGPVLFLYGGNSDYVQEAYRPVIRQRFPYARLRQLVGAGHWLYAEQPAEFSQALQAFIAPA
jgi:esterase